MQMACPNAAMLTHTGARASGTGDCPENAIYESRSAKSSTRRPPWVYGMPAKTCQLPSTSSAHSLVSDEMEGRITDQRTRSSVLNSYQSALPEALFEEDSGMITKRMSPLFGCSLRIEVNGCLT